VVAESKPTNGDNVKNVGRETSKISLKSGNIRKNIFMGFE
jgi:hypothetical protein